jgi:N-glycosylase/DNA lyase
MERGTIPAEELAGGIDLTATLESGQAFCWRRAEGEAYRTDTPGGWYHTVVDGDVVRVREVDSGLRWEATTDAVPLLEALLGLDADLPAIHAAAPDEPTIRDALAATPGLRVVRERPFRTLVSFICSSQMHVARNHSLQTALAETVGDTVRVDGETYHAYPTPEQLAATSEAQLRELGLGYRAPYVQRSAAMVADGTLHPEDVCGEDYEAAREALTEFVGVGPKVADCILLFSLGYHEAVPLDTWIHTAIEEHFPDCARDGYTETSRAIRERFGGDHAGYVQTAVFHHLRTAE